MIIGISGKAGSGKDTVARMITYYTMDPELRKQMEMKNSDLGPNGSKNKFLSLNQSEFNQIQQNFAEYLGFANVSFANSIKHIAYRHVGGDPWSREWKDNPLPSQWNIGDKNMLGREMLIKLGHEIRNHVHEDFWVNSLFRYYVAIALDASDQHPDISNLFTMNLYPDWVISDVRYLNEVEAIKNWDGADDDLRHVIRINCPPDQLNLIDHPSETQLDEYDDWDFVFNNRSESIPNIETLWEAVRFYMESYSELQEKMTL